jgi:hypothetical protein
MSKWLLNLSALALSATLIGCASEAEKQERRENAYDLSGTYSASRSTGSELDMNFEIINESGRHDIMVKVQRLEAESSKERDLLTAQGIDADQVFAHFGRELTMGKGYNKKHLEGGQNISDDFGASTRFFVCTEEYQYNKEYQIMYCLSGYLTKRERVMSGNLELRWFRSREVTIDGKPGTEYSAENTALSYKTDVKSVFYRQYLGQWSGDVYVIDGDFDGRKLGQLKIREDRGQNQFVTEPNVAAISFHGESFTYNALASQTDLALLKNPEFPAVQAVYQSESGKRIVMFGQIWSLGDLTGSVTLIDGPTQTDLATFRLKKD